MSGKRAEPPRLQAARALFRIVDEQRSIDSVMATIAEGRDRALVQELVYGGARWYHQLDAIAELLLQKPFKARDRELHMLLILGLYQLRHLDTRAHAAVHETVEAVAAAGKPWARGVLNACLRRAQREADDLDARVDRDPVLRFSHPRWLIQQLQEAYPNQWEAILDANNQRPPLHLRVNRRRISRTDYLARLAEADMTAAALPASDVGIALAQAVPVTALPGFSDGLVSVQDGAAQYSAELLDLAPGQRVLDACAAPGGKATHILEREPGIASLWMVEQSPERATMIDENLLRLGLEGKVCTADAAAPGTWWDRQPFQRILLDAPCSATGVIRRHPDIKLHRTPEQVRHVVELQARLLDALWPLLDRGGKLLYVTCSVLPGENALQIGDFLARAADAVPVALELAGAPRGEDGVQLLPGQQDGDGFYYACLAKK
ncbi:MAG: 16S rRNA (cytosine(967)-C(5))-methyltransferase RsmB [Acidiferrobacteraceae bacterium]